MENLELFDALKELRLDSLERTLAELGVRLSALEGEFFLQKSRVKKLEKQERAGHIEPPNSFRVVGLRANGSRSVFAVKMDLDEARRLRTRMISVSTFSQVVIEFEESAEPSTVEGRFLETYEEGR